MENEFKVFKDFVEITKKKRELKEQLKKLEEELGRTEQKVLDVMAENGMANLKIDGAMVYLSSFNTAKVLTSKEAAIDFTKSVAPELVKETYNTNTLNAWVREMLAENTLPEEFGKYFEIETIHKAKVRFS